MNCLASVLVQRTLPGGLSENCSLVLLASTLHWLSFGVSHSVYSEDAEAIPMFHLLLVVCCPGVHRLLLKEQSSKTVAYFVHRDRTKVPLEKQ